MNEQLSVFLKSNRRLVIEESKRIFYENQSSALFYTCGDMLLKASFELLKRSRNVDYGLRGYYFYLGLLMEASLKYKVGSYDYFWGALIDRLLDEGNDLCFDPNRDAVDNRRKIVRMLDYHVDKKLSSYNLLEMFKELETQDHLEEVFTEDEIKYLSGVKSKRNSAAHANSGSQEFQLDFNYEKEKQHLSALARIALNLTPRQLEDLLVVTGEALEAQMSSERECLLQTRWLKVIHDSKRSKKRINSSLREHLKDIESAITGELTPVTSVRASSIFPTFAFEIKIALLFVFLMALVLALISRTSREHLEEPHSTKTSTSNDDEPQMSPSVPSNPKNNACSHFVQGALSSVLDVKYASFDDLNRINLENAPHEDYCDDLKDQFNNLRALYERRVISFKELESLSSMENPISSKLVTLDLKGKEYALIHRLAYLGQKRLDDFDRCRQLGDELGELLISVRRNQSWIMRYGQKLMDLWGGGAQNQDQGDELILSLNELDELVKRITLTKSKEAHKASLPIEFAVLPSTARLSSNDDVVTHCGDRAVGLYEQMSALKECEIELQVNNLEEIKALQEVCEGIF